MYTFYASISKNGEGTGNFMNDNERNRHLTHSIKYDISTNFFNPFRLYCTCLNILAGVL